MKLAGHTLIEMLVVLVLTSIIALYGFSLMSNISEVTGKSLSENNRDVKLSQLTFTLMHDVYLSNDLNYSDSLLTLKSNKIECKYSFENKQCVRIQNELDSVFYELGRYEIIHNERDSNVNGIELTFLDWDSFKVHVEIHQSGYNLMKNN